MHNARNIIYTISYGLHSFYVDCSINKQAYTYKNCKRISVLNTVELTHIEALLLCFAAQL